MTLDGSGWIFQWRSDGYWRELGQAQLLDEERGAFQPGADEWVKWTGQQHHQYLHRSDSKGRSWIVAYEETVPGEEEKAYVVGAENPQSVILEGLWVCEWVETSNVVEVHHAGKHWFIRPEPTTPLDLPQGV